MRAMKKENEQMKDRMKENARSINVRMILMKIQVQMNKM